MNQTIIKTHFIDEPFLVQACIKNHIEIEQIAPCEGDIYVTVNYNVPEQLFELANEMHEIKNHFYLTKKFGL